MQQNKTKKKPPQATHLHRIRDRIKQKKQLDPNPILSQFQEHIGLLATATKILSKLKAILSAGVNIRTPNTILLNKPARS